MITNAKQALRQLAIFTPLGDDQLLLRKFAGREELSRLFAYDLELLSDNDALAGADILGRNVTFLARPEDGEPRFFNGYVSQFCHAGRTELATTYRATVVPWLWFLTQTADCRIFQNKAAPEIIDQIFRDLGFSGFELNLHGDYATREYCVQYRETDFDFVSRLMEEEGIFYFFRHENGSHTLCLADGAAAYFDFPDKDVEFGDPGERGDLRDQLTRWEHGYRFRSGRWAQTDYDFQTPRRDLMSRETSVVRLPNNQVYEIYDYPGRFEESQRGGNLTRVRMEEHEVPHDTIRGEATYRSFTPGGKFRVRSHTTPGEVGRQYVLTAVECSASVNDTYAAGVDADEPVFQARFEGIPGDVSFRPERRTRRPVVEGPQSAVVVGPPGEEIYPDEHGRIKVQFHWDREGSRDEHSSCWIRVSQIHAGGGWGSIDLPRIGEEVIVGFLEGDPDRPIIKGRVYNGRNQPPFGLPAQMTRSGGKSDTHQGSGYNEVTADDTAGAEQIRVNAQHNMDTTIGNNETLQVGVDRSSDIGNNDTLTIAVDATEQVGKDKSTKVGNNLDVVAGNHIVIEAGKSIRLACGASSIHMNQAGVITISGVFVSSAAKANHCIVAPLTEIVGSTALVQAGIVAMDLGGIVHIKGGSTALHAATIDIDGGETLLIGSPLKLGEVGAPIATLPTGASGSGSSASGAAGGSSASGPSGSASGTPGSFGDNEPSDNSDVIPGTPQERLAKIEASKQRAKDMADAAIRRVELARQKPGSDPAFDKHFGLDPSRPGAYKTELDVIAGNYQRAKDSLNEHSYTYQPNDPKLEDPECGDLAVTHTSRQSDNKEYLDDAYGSAGPTYPVVHVGDKFFSSSDNEKAETLLHEAMHASTAIPGGGAGIDDDGYFDAKTGEYRTTREPTFWERQFGYQEHKCKPGDVYELRELTHEEKMTNADTYSEFAQSSIDT